MVSFNAETLLEEIWGNKAFGAAAAVTRPRISLATQSLRPMSDFVHRALRFGEERKDRVDVDGILDQPQGDVDAGLLRAFSEARRIVEQAFALGCRDE